MGFLLLADWVLSEIKFASVKLETPKLWSYQYLLLFDILVIYHLVSDRLTELVQITLPRVFWGTALLSL